MIFLQHKIKIKYDMKKIFRIALLLMLLPMTNAFAQEQEDEQEQEQKRPVYYRDDLINQAMDRLLTDCKYYREKGITREIPTFDIRTLPESYLWHIPDSIVEKAAKEIEWVDSRHPKMIKRYKRSAKEDRFGRKGVRTIEFSWDMDDKGRVRIGFSFSKIYIDKKEVKIYEVEGESGIALYYKYSETTKKWELDEEFPPKELRGW